MKKLPKTEITLRMPKEAAERLIERWRTDPKARKELEAMDIIDIKPHEETTKETNPEDKGRAGV